MRGQAATLDGMRVDTFYIFFKSFWDLGASRVTGSVFHNLHEKKKKNTAVICGKASVILSVLMALRYISARKTAFVFGKKLLLCACLLPLLCCCRYCHEKNLHNCQPSWVRVWWTLPQKTVSLPMSKRVNSVLFTDGDSVTFQGAWWVGISITKHYSCIHMIINSQQLHV